MEGTVSTGAQTLANPRVATVDAGATSDIAAPEKVVEDACEESIHRLYQAGRARLDALHNDWTAALAEVRGSQVVAA